MQPVVLLFSKQSSISFISSVLSSKPLQTLCLGKKTYGQMLQELGSLKEGRWFYIDQHCPNGLNDIFIEGHKYLQKQGGSLQATSKVIVADMSFYPLDLEWLDHQFSKALQTDIPLFIHKTVNGQKKFVAACVTYAQLLKMVTSPDPSVIEPAQIEVGAQQLVNLANTETALRLFSSGFSLRHFNSLQPSRNIFFLKSSDNEGKMKAEYNFFTQLPSAVRPYFPHVGDFYPHDNGRKLAGYEIEVIPSLDVAKSLFNNVFTNEAYCTALVRLLTTYLDACPKKSVSKEEYAEQMQAAFVTKTRQRVDKTHQLPCIDAINHVCKLNGFDSLQDFSDQYISAVEADIKKYPAESLVFSHGDLFFSNILFDPTKEYIKLIDPRGRPEDNQEATYMPAWYDLAKLSHSFLGHYDLMVYDMTDIVMQPDLTLALQDQPIKGAEQLKQCFLRYLVEQKISLKRLRLYEGTLFLSMMPLHADDSLRMQRQLIRAIELFKFATQR